MLQSLLQRNIEEGALHADEADVLPSLTPNLDDRALARRCRARRSAPPATNPQPAPTWCLAQFGPARPHKELAARAVQGKRGEQVGRASTSAHCVRTTHPMNQHPRAFPRPRIPRSCLSRRVIQACAAHKILLRIPVACQTGADLQYQSCSWRSSLPLPLSHSSWEVSGSSPPSSLWVSTFSVLAFLALLLFPCPPRLTL